MIFANACQRIAFRVLIACGDHGAVQAKHHGVDGHGGAELLENFVAQAFIGRAADEAGRSAQVAVPSISVQPFSRIRAADGDRCGAERRRFRVLARRRIE